MTVLNKCNNSGHAKADRDRPQDLKPAQRNTGNYEMLRMGEIVFPWESTSIGRLIPNSQSFKRNMQVTLYRPTMLYLEIFIHIHKWICW